MTADTKQYIQLHLSILKETMKHDGITVSLQDLNRDLL